MKKILSAVMSLAVLMSVFSVFGGCFSGMNDEQDKAAIVGKWESESVNMIDSLVEGFAIGLGEDKENVKKYFDITLDVIMILEFKEDSTVRVTTKVPYEYTVKADLETSLENYFESVYGMSTGVDMGEAVDKLYDYMEEKFEEMTMEGGYTIENGKLILGQYEYDYNLDTSDPGMSFLTIGGEGHGENEIFINLPLKFSNIVWND